MECMSVSELFWGVVALDGCCGACGEGSGEGSLGIWRNCDVCDQSDFHDVFVDEGEFSGSMDGINANGTGLGRAAHGEKV